MTIVEQEWLKQMQDILEMLNEGVGISDDTGRILFVNQCMERLLGAPRSTLIGKTADAFYSGDDYEFTAGANGSDKEHWLLPIRILSSRRRRNTRTVLGKRWPGRGQFAPCVQLPASS